MEKLIPCAHCAPKFEAMAAALARHDGVALDVTEVMFGVDLHTPALRSRRGMLADWFVGVRAAMRGMS